MNEKKDLKWFINDNFRLLTAMGVFGGLTTLFTRLENASYLTFLSLMIFLVLSFEFWRKLPKTLQTTFSLVIFENLSLMLVVSVTVYIVVYYFMDFMTYLPTLTIVILGFLYLTSLRTVIAFFQHHKTTSKVFRFFGYVLLLLSVVFATSFILILINYLLGFK